MREKKQEKTHDLREGMPPPTSIDTLQIHSVLDSGRRLHHDGSHVVGPEGDAAHVPEGQDAV